VWVCTGAGVCGLVWVHGCGVWVYECMRVRVLGYGWEYRLMGVEVYGCIVGRCVGVGTWEYGVVLGVWLHGCVGMGGSTGV
jgi:hypothetical protein